MDLCWFCVNNNNNRNLLRGSDATTSQPKFFSNMKLPWPSWNVRQDLHRVFQSNTLQSQIQSQKRSNILLFKDSVVNVFCQVTRLQRCATWKAWVKASGLWGPSSGPTNDRQPNRSAPWRFSFASFCVGEQKIVSLSGDSALPLLHIWIWLSLGFHPQPLID